MSTVRARALARAALLGNPSDGYHGATLSFTFTDFAAEATVSRSPTPEVGPPGDPDGRRLVEATVARFARVHGGPTDGPVSVSYRSTIPREVGLGGSSAIVTAVLRALCALHDVTMARAELAALALAIETEDLGIAAGLQDRVAQAYEGLVFMDFDAAHMAEHGQGRYERLDGALLPPLYLAYRRDAARGSGVLHADLRARHARGDDTVLHGMARLRDLARRGRECLLAGDHVELARLMDRNLEERRSLGAADELSLAMAQAAREAGACANLAGSGGAIVGVRGEAQLEDLRAALGALGAEVIAPSVSA